MASGGAGGDVATTDGRARALAAGPWAAPFSRHRGEITQVPLREMHRVRLLPWCAPSSTSTRAASSRCAASSSSRAVAVVSRISSVPSRSAYLTPRPESPLGNRPWNPRTSTTSPRRSTANSATVRSAWRMTGEPRATPGSDRGVPLVRLPTRASTSRMETNEPSHFPVRGCAGGVSVSIWRTVGSAAALWPSTTPPVSPSSSARRCGRRARSSLRTPCPPAASSVRRCSAGRGPPLQAAGSAYMHRRA